MELLPSWRSSDLPAGCLGRDSQVASEMKTLSNTNHPPATLGEEFDSACMGYGLPTPTSEAVLIYNFHAVVDLIMQWHPNWTKDQAERYVKENFVEKYLGVASPILCLPEDEYLGSAKCS